jgi:hypothetical protein
MTLFRNALEEDGHPARQLVESDFLDALEFLWELNAISGAPPTFVTIRLADLQTVAESAGSERIEDFASALTSLVPGSDTVSRDNSALVSITVMVFEGRPILASSPFTGIFTAEDAGGPRTGQYFRFLHGAPIRTLSDRSFEFQQYIAEVLLPQLDDQSSETATSTAWSSVRRLLKPWLETEVARCNAKRRPGQRPLSPSPAWEGRASQLKLSRTGPALGGLMLFKRDAGAAVESSRWRLSIGRAGVAAPLVINPAVFDGVLFHGATVITLPSDLATLERDVLPVLGTRYPWVNPETDWFTERLFFSSEPINYDSAYGYAHLENSYHGDNSALKKGQFVLPLQPGILTYFDPESLDRMLRIRVYDTGQVEFTLTLQLGGEGARPVEIQKRYETSQHFRAPGPAVALYPTFRDPRWKNYVVFSRADNPATASMVRISAYNAKGTVAVERVRRSPVIEHIALAEAPDAIGFDTETAGTGERESSLGLLLPKYRPTRGSTQEQWHVGVDFGTSNTVVCVRPDGPVHAVPLYFDDGLLELTMGSVESRRAMSAFFFPDKFKSGPFGTAVVHHNDLQEYDLAAEHPGLRINVPFTGLLESDQRNTVVGDLKWSTDRRTDFLAGSFLRTVLSIILSEGIKRGIDPSRIKLTWAYPRAFSQAQVNNLTSFWHAVVGSFTAGGLNIEQPAPPMDESAAVLSHFFNDNKLAPGGEATVLIDVGGGTSDLAIYERGHALVLDSLLFGGKLLTGQRVQGNTREARESPFVKAFTVWARTNGLDSDSPEGAALTKYLADGQDHLAFSYALSTRWFETQGRRFVSDPAFTKLQGQILYFYSALFHYIGLTLRELRRSGALMGNSLPSGVIVAGNGSKYLHWLTEMVPSTISPFGPFLARIMAKAAGGDEQPLPTIRISEHPKLEVALGLVAAVPPTDLDLRGAQGSSLIGENIHVRFGQGGNQTLTSLDRLKPDWAFTATDVPSMRFDESNSEIAAFHASFLNELPSLASYGPQWGKTAKTFRDLLGKLPARELHAFISARLQYLAQLEGGFRGSLLMLEASAVLEMTSPELFGSNHEGGARPS